VPAMSISTGRCSSLATGRTASSMTAACCTRPPPRCGDESWPSLRYSPGERRKATPMSDNNTVIKPKAKVVTKTERPRLHKVILVNDDYTPREFVVRVLQAEFRMSEDQAHNVMITAHRR